MKNNILEINDNTFKNEQNKKYPENNYNKQNTENEGIPILSSIEDSFNSVEDYYKINYPEYKIIKFRNFTFIKMGNLLTFYFDKKNNYIPKFSIGPHWYLTIILLLSILFLVIMTHYSIFRRVSSTKRIIFYLFVISIYYFVLGAALVHPKVVMNKKRTNEEYVYCSICKCYYRPYNKVEHCEDCKVCVEKMDHHCVWMGKCIAKNNTYYFYGLLVDAGILYVFIIFSLIILALEKKFNKNKVIKTLL